MTTVILHIYNEEFLLPYWLDHHKRLFDQGIIIDFNSSDRSIQTVKSIVPDWAVIQSPFEEFDSDKLDRFIEEIEKNIVGPRITLTITEFFIGDPSLVEGQLIIPEVSLINQSFDKPFVPGTQFFEQRDWGLISNTRNVTNNGYSFPKGNGRSIHDYPIKYPIGRHFIPVLPSIFLIVRVNDCLVSEEMYMRRLQIQHKMPRTDIAKNYGVEHTNHGKGLTRNDLVKREEKQREISVYIGGIIEQALKRQRFSTEGRLTSEGNEELLAMWREAVNNFRYSSQSQPYTAGTSFVEEVKYIRESYESSPVFKATSRAKRIVKRIRTK